MEINLPDLRVHNGCAYFCISHVEPFFLLPDYFNLIKTQDFLSSHRGPTFSLLTFLDFYRIVPKDPGNTSDYAVLLIHHLLSSESAAVHFVYISNHRKVVVFRGIGAVSKTYLPNYEGLYFAEPLEVHLADLDFSQQRKVMVTAPVVFPDGILGQYAGAHSIADFLRFCLVCREGGILSDRELVDFIRSNVFFPVLFLGFFPADFFRNFLGKFIEFVQASEMRRFELDRESDPYQKRARAFFMERLLSFLFIRIGLDFGIFSQSQNRLLLSGIDIGRCVVLKSKNGEQDYIIGS